MSEDEAFLLWLVVVQLLATAIVFPLAVRGAFRSRARRRYGTRYRLRVHYYATLRKKWGFVVSPIADDRGTGPSRVLAPVATGRRRTRATAILAARWKARRHARAKRLEARSWEWEVRR